jgi:hypothetical protein
MEGFMEGLIEGLEVGLAMGLFEIIRIRLLRVSAIYKMMPDIGSTVIPSG